MPTIASINAASATSTNWLKEAQQALAAAEAPAGLLGALQDARHDPASLKVFLAKSQNAAANLAMITMNTQGSALNLTMQMAATAMQKRAAEHAAQVAKANPPQVNYNPPHELDPVIYFDDGSSIDTVSNVMTLKNGTQIDTTTGIQVIDPASIISMANGAYLDTKKNILTMADGTRIDTVTGLTITA
jgi:hypothetical protein